MSQISYRTHLNNVLLKILDTGVNLIRLFWPEFTYSFYKLVLLIAIVVAYVYKMA
jgi:hypothetical protein